MNYILTDADKAKIEQALEKAETLVIGSMPNTHPWSQQMREALSILRALPAQQAGDMVMVPREPTEEMMYRGGEATSGLVDWGADSFPDDAPGNLASAVYAAMLAAAPAIPAQQAGQPAALLSELPSVVEAVEFRREQYGMNQGQWAKLLGMQASHYSEFVHGKRHLPVTAMAIAYAFGVPAECLFQVLPTLGAGDIDRRLSSDSPVVALAQPAQQAGQPEDAKDDPLQGAVDWLLEADGEFFCVATVQRTLRIGYNRAKRLSDTARQRKAAMSSPTAKKGEGE